MRTHWTPMRWPGAWKNPELLSLLDGTAIDCLLDAPATVVQLARNRGMQAGTPAGVRVIPGDWPGVKLTESGKLDHAAAGPTGAPWVDSNGWKIRLEAALYPGTEIWIDAAPQKPRLYPDSYVIAVADAAAQWGRWIISLDDALAAGLASGNPEARGLWAKLTGAASFFAARKEWSEYEPQAIVGILSDFRGGNEIMSHELLNLVARTNQQYRVLPKTTIGDEAFAGLKAVLYTDDEPPAPQLAGRIDAFVKSGGLLVTGPRWGTVIGEPAQGIEHPRYEIRTFGAGRIAVHKTEFDDPYLVANDALILVSHRYELLRFWNAGAVGSSFGARRGGREAVAQLLFYAFILGNQRPTVRVAGHYGSAKLWTLAQDRPSTPELRKEPGGIEVYLPQVSGYAALELGE